jgi:archaellum component FlaC
MAYRQNTFENSFSSTFNQALPSLFARTRSEPRLVKTSAAPVQQASNKNLTDQIRLRNKKSQISVDPELAVEVVKGYLLPMFEAKSKNIAAKVRSFKFGTDDKVNNHETRNATSETVYHDLKLAEQLKSEIDYLRQELEKSKRESMDSKQLLGGIENESNQIKEKYERLQMNFELIKFQLTQQSKYIQRIESKGRLFIEQFEKYKQLYHESTEREDDLILKLHKEKSENDIRFIQNYP